MTPQQLSRRSRLEMRLDRILPSRLQPHREQVHYLAVGFWNTLFGYAAFVVLYALLGDLVGFGPIIVASYVLAVLNAYVGYRYVAFRSRGSVIRELPRFAGVYVGTMVANLVLFPVLAALAPGQPYLVQAAFTVGVVCLSYVAHRRFSFGAGPGRSSGGK